MREAKAVLEMLLCPIVLLGWNHKPQSEKHRCAAFFFFSVGIFFFLLFLLFERRKTKQRPLRGWGCETVSRESGGDVFRAMPSWVPAVCPSRVVPSSPRQ